MRLTFGTFVKGQLFKAPKPVVKSDLTGKTVIVLGANTGLGFEATKHFARMNAGRLILACRSQSRGQAAVDKLKAETGYGKAELWLIDLADFESVKQFAGKFERDGGRLDILVENAGVGGFTYESTKDGWETCLQVNDLATPLLALLLLPAMIKTATEHATMPRLVVVSSETHHWVQIDPKIIEKPDMLKTMGSTEYCKTPVGMKGRYELSKLFNILFVRALNDRIPRSTPLVVNTISGIGAVIVSIIVAILAFTAEQGSRQLVWGAVAEQDQSDKLRGQYISASGVQEVSDFVLSPEGAKVQNRVWNELVEILSKIDPRVAANVDQYLST
ncbi:hypothetical protein C8R47DRAFT_1227432 [Mycena vitilis]|nr:hypothetical protein C8R47DRAFT_1227432 [Mycena vitilis]